MPDEFDHQQTLFHVTARLMRRLNLRLRDALSPYALHPAQFTALAEISDREGLTQSELVQRLDLEQPGVARTLRGLEAEGWIEKSTLGKGRAQGLYLSEQARAVLPDAAAAVAAAERAVLVSLSRTEAAHLLDDLAVLTDELRD